MRSVFLSALAAGALAASVPAALAAQQQPASQLTIDRIFRRGDFASEPLPSVHWLADGRSYLDVRPDPQGGSDIVRVDLATGRATTLADASQLVDERGQRIDVEDITLSDDESKALLFHNSVRVWRSNTRGVYHVIDFRTGKLTPIAQITTPGAGVSRESDTTQAPMLGKQPPSFLGRGLASGAADPELQMFAKFSPDGRQVAFVRGNNLWVTDLATGRSRALTTDGSDDVINGTTDWVYEEELGLRDAFRWSPDSRQIAYWRFDQSAVPAYPMENDLAGQYPTVSVLRYPKAGAPNSRVKVGVLDVAAPAATRWIDVGADTGLYIARMDWVGNDSLVVQRLPRKQNRVDVLMASAATGGTRLVLSDSDSAYVNVEGEALTWLPGQRQFLWRSDRSGWQQFYLYDRSGRLVRQVTRDGADVLELEGIDAGRRQAYFQVAAPDPTQRQVYRYALDRAGAAQRVTTTAGAHDLTIGPGARYAVDFHSTISAPYTATAYALPSMKVVRPMAENRELREKLAALDVRAPQFFKLPMPDGTLLDAYRIVPANFDSTKHYPVLMYVYGGPAAPTVVDSWGGSRYLWHQLLAQHGYVVVSVDNRGAAWRGRDFRKVTQYHLGMHESSDQVDAAKWLARQSWVDPQRIGLWGWSYGGYMTTLTLGRGGDVFKAGIAVAPVTDWRYYDSIYTERYMWIPQENEAGYTESASLSHAGGMRARLLLAFGTGDDNVHPQNSIALTQKMEEANVDFRMLLYPNKTHAIAGPVAQSHLFGSMTRFIIENL